jgi:hypothetical protein
MPTCRTTRTPPGTGDGPGRGNAGPVAGSTLDPALAGGHRETQTDANFTRMTRCQG